MIIKDRKISKVGGSLTFAFTPEFIQEERLQKGDIVTLDVQVIKAIHMDMPLKTYICRKCGAIFDFNRFEINEIYCPVCGLEGKRYFIEKIDEALNEIDEKIAEYEESIQNDKDIDTKEEEANGNR